MSSLLWIYAHPNPQKSKINRELFSAVAQKTGIIAHDLYQKYPDFFIQVEEEKNALESCRYLVWQHPLYWYSVPPLLKQWFDDVLEYGWAYGPGGDALRGKKLLHIISTGGDSDAYHSAGMHKSDLRSFLKPIEETARLCGLDYLEPFVVYGSGRVDGEKLTLKKQELEIRLEEMRS